MKKHFVALSIGAGPLSEQEISFANVIANLIKTKQFQTVFIAYGSALDSDKVKEIYDIMEKIAQKANFLGFNGFSCLNSRQTAFGYQEVINTINDFNSDVNIIIVDTESRETKKDPMPAFLDNFRGAQILLDLNAAIGIGEKQFVESPAPVHAGAMNGPNTLSVTLN